MAKELTNPFSSGGGGVSFETRVQAAYVVLMLTGGRTPCLPSYPIVQIKLQGKYEGFATDDFIVFAEDQKKGRKSKLLAQIKHSISITQKDSTFREVLESAWSDFNNARLFNANTDKLALITGPLSATDTEAAVGILDWSRTSASAEEFLKKVQLAQFSSDDKREKLKAFRTNLDAANKSPISDEQLFAFLKCFYLLGYDLNQESGVMTSLLKSHIGQYVPDDIDSVWAKIVLAVDGFNHRAGTITLETLPPDIVQDFSSGPVSRIPVSLLKPDAAEKKPMSQEVPAGDRGDALMFASLVGSWNEKSAADKSILERLLK